MAQPQTRERPENKPENVLFQKFKQVQNLYKEVLSIQDETDRLKKLRNFNDTINEIKKRMRAAKDSASLSKVLEWEFGRGRLKEGFDEWYEYNAIEEKTCEHQCEMHKRIKAGRYKHFDEGKPYKYKSHFNPGAGSNGLDFYTVFAPLVIPSEDRIKASAQNKIRMGLNVSQDDYLPALELVDRVVLNEAEWKKYFRHIDDVDLDKIGETENQLESIMG